MMRVIIKRPNVIPNIGNMIVQAYSVIPINSTISQIKPKIVMKPIIIGKMARVQTCLLKLNPTFAFYLHPLKSSIS